MAYAAKADVIARGVTEAELVQLTDDTGTGAVDDTVLSSVLTEASATVDSYCRLRYAVPLQSSEKVKGLTVDLAIYQLFSRRRRVTDDIKDRYNAAMKFLVDVSAGKAALDQPANATAQSGSGPVLTTDQEERFGDDNIQGFV